MCRSTLHVSETSTLSWVYPAYIRQLYNRSSRVLWNTAGIELAGKVLVCYVCRWKATMVLAHSCMAMIIISQRSRILAIPRWPLQKMPREKCQGVLHLLARATAAMTPDLQTSKTRSCSIRPQGQPSFACCVQESGSAGEGHRHPLGAQPAPEREAGCLSGCACPGV